jgi:hypothetical protein
MKSCCLASLVIAALAVAIHAQTGQPSQIVPPIYTGTSIEASFHFDRQTQRTQHSVTLNFGPAQETAFTVAYEFEYPGTRVSQPAVVDEVITQEIMGSVQTRMSTSLGGDWTPSPFPIRLTRRTAFTRSMPIDYFTTLVQSPVVRERVLGVELAFNDLQLRMLRSQTVDHWQR